jgi:secondary thiamine-phosphate synthase enzyme
MRQADHVVQVSTRGRGLTEITGRIVDWLSPLRPQSGLLTIYCRHTSASLLIQENADPSVQRDLERAFERLAPENAGYEHDTEGPDDMPAHIRAALSQTTLGVPVIGGRLALGTWQGVYLFEHRRAAHRREIVLHYIGF